MRRSMMTATLWLVAGTLAPGAARADISFVDLFRNDAFVQTSNGNTSGYAPTPSGSFFSADLFSVGANDYNTVSMTFPGPSSPLNIPKVDPLTFHFQTASLANQAAMDAAFPMGTYSFTASNGGTTATATASYTADDYARSLPFLTGTNFSDLQGMNSTRPFTFQFSPFVTGPLASSSFIFLTIFDFTTGTFVFNAGFLPPTTTSVVLAANTLAPNHRFGYELDFSNRDLVTGIGARFAPQLGFDVRTTGTFQSVPEPSSLCLVGIGGLIVAGCWSRRRKAGA
jgi:hypothetical protein